MQQQEQVLFYVPLENSAIKIQPDSTEARKRIAAELGNQITYLSIRPVMQVYLGTQYYTFVHVINRTDPGGSYTTILTTENSLLGLGEKDMLYLFYMSDMTIYYYKFNHSEKSTYRYLSLVVDTTKITPVTITAHDTIATHDALAFRNPSSGDRYNKDSPNLVVYDFLHQQFDIIEKRVNQATLFSQGGGSSKIHILGRHRKIHIKGRTKYVTYNKELIKLSEAKKLDKQMKKKYQ